MTIHFPDLSHYQRGLSLAGAVAVFCKGDQGSSFHDPAYVEFKAEADQMNIPFAGYHWVDDSPTAAQAANAVGVMGQVPIMWDAEAPGATVERLVDLTNQARSLGGNPRLVYLPHWWWQGHLGSPSLVPLVNLGLTLVSSSYTSYSDSGPGWAPYGGVTPGIWQWTDRQPFNGQLVDFNAYLGTVDGLRILLGLGNPIQDKENPPMRFTFDATVPGVPPSLVGRVHVTDGLRYRVLQLTMRTDQLLGAAGAGPITLVTAATLPPGWDYLHAVSQLCGIPDTNTATVDATAVVTGVRTALADAATAAASAARPQ